MFKVRNTTWHSLPSFGGLDAINNWVWSLVYLSGNIISYMNHYVNKLLLPFSSTTSIMGFMLLLTIAMQLTSGFFLGWYYIPEPGLVIELREEMFNDTRFGVEVFYMHVRGVDVLFVLSYLHILKKIFIKNYIIAESDGWLLGGYAFFWFHIIVFLGISLSATHLSDLTLTIGANIFWSILNFAYKTYYIIFTNKHLNTDQLARLMVLHYFTPWYYLYLVQLHLMFCHESWDTDSGENTLEDKSGTYVSWFYDGLLKEMQDAWFWSQFVFIYWVTHHFHASTVNYHFFERWNISELDEIRFYGVAPHWYFRPLMGLLTITPTHYEGLLWMAMWFVLLGALPLINSFYNSGLRYVPVIPMQSSMLQTSAFIIYMLSIYCVSSMLPCGRYYYDPEGGYVGNPWVKFSYQYAYLYMAWIVHHLDVLEHYSFQFSHTFVLRYAGKRGKLFWRHRWYEYMRNVNNWNGKWDPDKLVNKLPFKDLSTGLYRKNKVWSEKAQILGAPYPEAFFQRYEEGLYLKDRKVRRFSFTALHKYLWQKEWDAKYAIWWRINNLPAHLQRPPFPLPRNVEKQLKKTQGLQFILQKRLRQTKDWHRIVTTKLKQLKRRG